MVLIPLLIHLAQYNIHYSFLCIRNHDTWPAYIQSNSFQYSTSANFILGLPLPTKEKFLLWVSYRLFKVSCHFSLVLHGLDLLNILKSRLLSSLSLHIHTNLQTNILEVFFFSSNIAVFFLKYLKLLGTGIIHLNKHQLLCSAIFFLLFVLWTFLFFLLVCVLVSDKVRGIGSPETRIRRCYEPPNLKAGTWT